MLSPIASLARRSARDEHGFTLVELLVAMVSGLVVTAATFSLLDVSLHQSANQTERVSANQRGRLAMEKIMLELHSSCVAASVRPIQSGSKGDVISFISQSGSEAAFAHVTLHTITYNEETKTLTDVSYLSSEGTTAATWKFPKAATSSQTLLTKVGQYTNSAGVTQPVFSYYKYVKGELSATALATPLSAADAEETAEVTVSFSAAPEDGNTAKGRSADFSNTAVLRFDPASATGVDSPCA